MNNTTCNTCYHWHEYGYCSIEPEPVPCQWFVDIDEVDKFFSGGQAAEHGREQALHAPAERHNHKAPRVIQFDGEG